MPDPLLIPGEACHAPTDVFKNKRRANSAAFVLVRHAKRLKRRASRLAAWARYWRLAFAPKQVSGAGRAAR